MFPSPVFPSPEGDTTKGTVHEYNNAKGKTEAIFTRERTVRVGQDKSRCKVWSLLSPNVR